MTMLARLKSIFNSLSIGFVLQLAIAYFKSAAPAISHWLTGPWHERVP